MVRKLVTLYIHPVGRNMMAAVPDREPLAGLVERVTYHNPDNGYCVLRVQVRGHRDLVTVLGHAASISPGEFVQASGKWEVHREHGQQFRAAFLKSAPLVFMRHERNTRTIEISRPLRHPAHS